MSIVVNKTDIAKSVRDLADQFEIDCSRTPTDLLATHFTRLSGDNVRELDETQYLLVALRRAGHIEGPEFIELQAAYLRQKLR